MRTTTALIAVLLVWGGPVFAAVWDAGGDGTLWTNPANWNPDGVPGPGDVAGIEIDNGGRSITTSVAITISELEMKDFFDETLVLSAAFTCTVQATVGPVNATLDCNGNDLTVAGFVRVNGTLDAHTGGDPSVSIGELFIRGGGTYNATAGSTTITKFGTVRSTPVYTNGGRFIHNQGTFHINPGPNGDGALQGAMTGSNAFYDLVWDFTDGDIQSSIDIVHDLTITQKVDVRFDPPGATTDDIVMTLGETNYASTLIGPSGCCGFSFISADGFNLTIQGKTNTLPAKVGGSGGPVMEIFRGADSQTPDELHLGAITIFHSLDPVDIRADSVDVFIDDTVEFENIGGSKGFELGSGNTLSVQDNTLIFSNSVATFRNLNGATTTVTTGTILLKGGVTFTNGGVFTAGSSTVTISNGNSTVYNNGQAFNNLTTAAGGGNTITLLSNSVSAVNGLLHVIDGTCDIPGDNITQSKVGAGTFVELGPFGTDIAMTINPQVDAGATLRAGLNAAAAGTVVTLR
jgi:hypothetical protein